MSFGSLPSVLGNGGGVAISVIGGTGLFADGTAAAPSISFASDSDTGLYRSGTNQVGVSIGGVAAAVFANIAGVNPYLAGFTGGGYLQWLNTGGLNLVAGGTNQNITLTPSGTGQVSHIGLSNFSDTLFFGNSSGSYGRITWGSALTFQAGAGLPFTLVSSNGTEVARGFANGRFGIGTGATDSGALLQVGTNTTTSAGGMVFGTDTFLFRSTAGSLILNGPSQTSFSLSDAGTPKTRIEIFGSDSYLSALTGSLIFRTNGAFTALTLDSSQNAAFAGTVKPQLATTAGAPAYVKGAIYFDTTLNKLRVGGATAWETITSV